MTNEILLEDLYVGVLLTLIFLIVIRKYRVSIWFYITHSFLLSLIYVWYAYNLNNPMMYLWFFTTILSQVVLIPFAPGGLFYTVKKCNATEVRPILPFGVSLAFIALLAVGGWEFFHYIIAAVAPTPEAALEPARSNLAIAFTIFSLGLYTLLTRKDAVKTVLALCIMGNGIDVTLVDLTPAMAETAVLGILTDVILSVFILLYLSRRIYEKFGSLDTMKLSELKY
ncbi:MAG: NADH-quinone oxidoreductase subunit K [Acidobacteria bacterium]|nr:NADH-quinone oxidoreductase subunit K [Acidobacteriota bacterium]